MPCSKVVEPSRAHACGTMNREARGAADYDARAVAVDRDRAELRDERERGGLDERVGGRGADEDAGREGAGPVAVALALAEELARLGAAPVGAEDAGDEGLLKRGRWVWVRVTSRTPQHPPSARRARRAPSR